MKTTKKQIGIEYKLTGDSARGEIERYHYKPAPLKLNKTPYAVDVAGLKPAGVRQAIKIDGAVYESKFTIGMEVEKNNLHRGAVREYELFCGFERDGSCGYEAVTHILPLLPESKWRTKIYDMMHKAEKIIDDRYSPSSSNCGGHITLAVDGLTGAQLNAEVREYSGIVLAMFRNRLKNLYCGANRRMQASGLDGMYNSAPAHRHSYDHNGWHYKYQTALVKGDLLEFRLPSRFESVKQMMRRYELMYELVNFAVNVQGTQKAFFAKIRPIVLSMYNGETEKTDEIFKLAVDFQKFINTGVISDAIAQYLR